ncbi:restriction endonuclease subunit S [Pseudomonas sp. SIMBA_064]
MSELPKGWAITSLKELVSANGLFSDGDWIESKDQDPNGENRLLQLADIGDGLFLNKSFRFVNNEKFQQLNCTELNEGDLLIARMPEPLGRACLMPKLKQRCLTVVDVAVFRSGSADISHKLLMHFINSPALRKSIEVESSGTTRKRIARGKLADLNIPIPPAAEQTKIAHKLDELLAQVHKLKARIDAIPALLKRFRQSVLAAAASGRLTEEWRGNSSSPSLSQPPLVFSERDLGLTPKDWRWEKLVSLAELESGHTPRKSTPTYWENGDVPWISLQDIRAADGKEISETKYMPTMLGIENSSARLLPKGTVCLSRDISVGFVTIMGRSMATSQHFANWICNSELLPKYLMYSFMAAREHLLQSGKGTTVKTIYMPELKELRLLLPPLSEQKEIIQRTERFLIIADRLEAKIATAKAHIDKITQCILAKAFRGEFTEDWREQNPSLISGTQSADALLEKIKNSRKEHPQKPRPKRNATRSGAQMKQQIVGVLKALEAAGKPLTGQQLLVAAGYPLDSSADQLEQFFLDIRSVLAEKKVIKQSRDSAGQDWFTLKKPAHSDKDIV